MVGLPFFVLKCKNDCNIKLTLNILNLYGISYMANHKSAKKRSIQSKSKNAVNTQYLTKFRTNLNKFHNSLKGENTTEVQNSFKEINSILAKAVKKGIIKKQYMSRKLSSLSKQIKKN